MSRSVVSSSLNNRSNKLIRERLESMVILLSDRFRVLTEPPADRETHSLVKLTENYLYYHLKPDIQLSEEKHDNLKLIAINDIIGCNVLKRRLNHDGREEVLLNICGYPLKSRGKLGLVHRQLKRVRTIILFLVSKFDSLEANYELAEKWRRTLLWLISNKSHLFLSDCSVNIPDVIPQKRRLLVFINPSSGPGKALEIFERRVLPVLNDSDVSFKVITTKYSKCGTVFIREMKDLVADWDGIVVVSGDGLLFEVFNGLMQRVDWEAAIKIPVGVIPGGSGNGIAHSIHYASGEPSSCNAITSAALNIVKGKTIPMDLVRIKTKQETFYSCLSVGWGLISDIDIESERLRLVGGARFTIWAIIRAIGLRKYRGRLSYLPVTGYIRPKVATKPNFLTAVIPRSRTMTDHKEGSFKKTNERLYRSSSLITSEDSVSTLGEADCQSEHLSSNAVPVSFCSSLESQLNTYSKSSLDLNSNTNSTEVSTDWVTLDEEFVLVYSSYQTHISSSCFFTPGAKFDDGIIWLIYLKGSATRSQVLQFLASLDSGNHIKLPYVHNVPVRAFKLVPYKNEGRITVDGELIETGPIEADVLPSVARLMSR